MSISSYFLFLFVVQFMMQIKFNFNYFIFYGVSAAAWQRARGIRRRRWQLWLAYPIMTSFRYVPYVPYVACVALRGNPASVTCGKRSVWLRVEGPSRRQSVMLPQIDWSTLEDARTRLRITLNYWLYSVYCFAHAVGGLSAALPAALHSRSTTC